MKYGGQALIEGVLIRGQSGVFAAVRAPDGRVITREERFASRQGRAARVPVVRGLLALGDTVWIGTRMLMFSADVAAGGTGEMAASLAKRTTLGAASAAAVAFAVAPNLLSELLRRRLRRDKPPRSGLGGALVEGGARLAILVGYLGFISRLKEVQRLFAYHGAEHKSISALEASSELTPEAVQRFGTAHPRCGTAFLLQSMLTSTVVYGVLGDRLPLGKLVSRVILLPLVAGLSFEVLQFNARHLDSTVVQALNAPGMLLQRLTTRQPSDDQVEVAIRALQGAMAMDQDNPERGGA